MQLSKKTTCLGIISLLLGIYAFVGVSLALDSTHLIGNDNQYDLRKFESDFLEDELEDEIDFSINLTGIEDNLNKLFTVLEDNWDNNNSETIEEDEYEDYENIDMKELKIKNLDKDNATFVLKTHGDLEESEGFLFLFWSNCSNSDDFLFGYIYGVGDIGGKASAIFFIVDKNNNRTGEAELDGSKMSFQFPSDWFEEYENCGIKAIMLTAEDLDDPETFIIDIFPNKSIVDILLENWIWILIITGIIVGILVVAYLILRQVRKRSKPSSSKRSRS